MTSSLAEVTGKHLHGTDWNLTTLLKIMELKLFMTPQNDPL